MTGRKTHDHDQTRQPPHALSHLANSILGLVLAALALLALLWLIPNHTQVALSEYDISPQLFPQLAAWGVLVLALGLTLLSFLSMLRQRSSKSAYGTHSGVTVAAELVLCVIAGVVSMVALANIGFLLTAPMLIALGAVFAGYRKVWLIVLVAVAIPLLVDQAAWHIFTVKLP